MMRKMCILVPLLLFLSPVCGHLLRFTQYSGTNRTSWGNAQAFCRKHHTDLVTIKDEQDNTFFSGFGWIALYRDSDSSTWKWSREGKRAYFTKWDTNEPQPSRHCAYKHIEKWRTDVCSARHSFMCYDDLILVKENKTWEQALEHCRSLGRVDTDDPASPYWNHRFNLASLITPHDHTTARKTAQEATTDEVWTGLRYLAGEWLWVDGEQMQYEDIPNCPTEGFCGVLGKNSAAHYGIRDCQLRRNFLCYKRP